MLDGNSPFSLYSLFCFFVVSLYCKNGALVGTASYFPRGVATHL